MASSETVEVGGKKFHATKLTMRQIRDVLLRVEDKNYRSGIIDNLFVDGLPEPAFLQSLDISIDDLDDLSPEDVKQLMEAVAAANPIYAEMEKRISASMENIETIKRLQRTLSETASA